MSTKTDDAINAAIESTTKLETAQASLLNLFNKFAQIVRDNKDDPAAIAAIATRMEALSQTATDAVLANTDLEESPEG